MEEVLKALLSPDNTTRTEAETSLKSTLTGQAEAAIPELVSAVGNQNPEIALMALIVLKKYYVDEGMGEIVLKLSNSQKQDLFGCFNQNFNPNKNAAYNRKLLDLMTMLANALDRNTEMLQFLCGMEGKASTLSFYGIQIMVERYLSDKFATDHFEAFSQVLGNGLKSEDLDTRVAALKATCQFLLAIQEDSVVLQFKAVLPVLVETLIQALKNNEETGNEVLSSLIDLTQGHAEVWEGTAEELVSVMAQVADVQAEFEDGTRRQAVELISQLSQQCPRLLRKNKAMKEKFIPVLFQMLAQPEHGDNLNEWNSDLSEGEEADLSKNDPHSVAKSGIAQIAFCMGEKPFMEMAATHMQSGLTHQDWTVRMACVMATGVSADACKAFYKKNMAMLLETLAPTLSDPHPRVRYSGITALSLICQVTSPRFQNAAGASYLEKLCQVLNDDEFSKNKLHSVSAMIDFCRGVLLAEDQDEDETTQDDEKESAGNKLEASKGTNLIKSVAQTLLKALVDALQTAMTSKFVRMQEEILGLISLVASVIESSFLPFFDELTMGLSNLFESTPTTELEGQSLRAKVITTIGCMISALSQLREEENVMTFTKNYLNKLVELKANKATLFKPEDPQIVAISQAFIHIAEFLKQDFSSYMPAVLTPLVEELELEIDFQVENADMETVAGTGLTELKKSKDGQIVASKTMDLKGVDGPVKMSMKTFAFQQKEEAAKAIRALCESMGAALQPQIVQGLLPIVTKYTSFKFSTTIRKSTIKTLKHFLKAPKDEPSRAALFTDSIFPNLFPLVEKAVKVNNLADCKMLIKQISRCVNEFPLESTTPPLPMDFVGQLYMNMVKAYKGVNEINMQALSQITPDTDPEDQKVVMDDMEENLKVVSHIMDLSGSLLKRYRGQLDDMLEGSGLIDLFAQTLTDKHATAEMLIDPICFFGETMDYASLSLFQKLAQLYIPRLFELLVTVGTDNVDIQQNIAYILGVVAQRASTEQFAPMKEMVSTRLIELINHPEAKGDDRIIATETFIGALGRVVLFQPGTVDQQIASGLYLGNLPLVAESEQAMTAHNLLFEAVITKNPVIAALKTDIEGVFERMKHMISTSDEEKGNELRDEIYTQSVMEKLETAINALS